MQINITRIEASTSNRDDDESEEEEQEVEEKIEKKLPPGLLTWRTAVARATSAAQLHLCIHQLTNSISWEKSVMKVVSIS